MNIHKCEGQPEVDLKYLEQHEWKVLLKRTGHLPGGPSIILLQHLAHLALPST